MLNSVIIFAMSITKVKHTSMAVVGFLLSPLSWWNDAFINIPLAYVFGTIVGLLSKSLFMPAVIFGYWLTNIIGFILLHHGIKGLRKSDFSALNFRKTVFVSCVYTLLVILLIKFHIIKSPF
jgi:hypothetical protein